MKNIVIYRNNVPSFLVTGGDWVVNGAWEIKINFDDNTFYIPVTGATFIFDRYVEVEGADYNKIFSDLIEKDNGIEVDDDDYGLGIKIL